MNKILLLTILLLASGIPTFADQSKKNYVNVEVGSPKKVVLDKLGKPNEKFYFGSPSGINELWMYSCQVLTPCNQSCIPYYYELPCLFALFNEKGELSAINNLK